MNIDIHSHFIPKEFIKLVRKGDQSLKVKITNKSGAEFMKHEQGYVYPLERGFYDLEYRLKYMKDSGIDMAALSVAPPLLYYDANELIACKVARMVNNGIAEAVAEYPDKFLGVASVPMQHIDNAVEELSYAIYELGFRMVQIGSNIEGKQLDAPEILPFFAKAEELGALVIVHPYYVGEKGSLEKFYLTNLVGNPLDTTLSITHLIFGGVLDKFPQLKLCFVHGGGYFPYQIGRLDHGHNVRKEPKTNGAKKPSSYFNQLFFDTILFDQKALAYLVDTVGSEHIMMGTDYPFDMSEAKPVDFIEGAISDRDKQKALLGNNVIQILGI